MSIFATSTASNPNRLWQAVAIGVICLVTAGSLWYFFRPKETPFTKAVSLVKSGKTAAALPILEGLTRTDPENAQVYPWLAQCYLSTDRLPEGRTALDTALKLKLSGASVIPVVLSFSKYYEDRQDYEEAEKLLQAASNIYFDPELIADKVKLYLAWAQNDTANGDSFGAMQRLESAHQISSRLSPNLKQEIEHQLSSLYRELAANAELNEKNDDRAIELYQKGLIVADEPMTRMALAQLYARTGKYELAIDNYRHVAQVDENNLEARHRLVELLLQRKEYVQAQEALMELTDKERSAETYEMLAGVNEVLGNYAGVVRALEGASEFKPNDAKLIARLKNALVAWSNNLISQGKTDEAAALKGRIERVAETLKLLTTTEEELLAQEAARKAALSGQAVPVNLAASRIWLAAGSLTPEGEIRIKNISGAPIAELTLQVVFYDKTARRSMGSVYLPVAGTNSAPFMPDSTRFLYFSCPNIVKAEHQLSVIISFKGRSIKELPVVKQR
jgi:tetratricopeptide (TPR) repeat protein